MASQRIKSFVLRQGHFSMAKKNAMQAGLLKWGIPYEPALLNGIAFFDRQAPTILEIGFGMGTATADVAMAYPQNNYLCVEVYGPGVAHLLTLIERHAITNIRIIHYDAVAVVENMIAPLSLDGAHIFFPDPWPKKRHHKRRLIQLPFVMTLADRLKPNGYLHCATDWEDYAQQMHEVLSACPLLKQAKQPMMNHLDQRPLTKFEARGLHLGHAIQDFIFTKEPYHLPMQNVEKI